MESHSVQVVAFWNQCRPLSRSMRNAITYATLLPRSPHSALLATLGGLYGTPEYPKAVVDGTVTYHTLGWAPRGSMRSASIRSSRQRVRRHSAVA
jgi:hypothetical protein